jgi:predicted dehydrogenase
MDSRPELLIASRLLGRRSVSPTTKPLRFALLGTGFWARYQLGAWRELPGARCVALYNRTRSKAEALGREMGIGAVYDDAEELLRREDVDFLDVVTDPSTHARFVELAVAHGKAVICQKPMANALAIAERMVHACRESGVPFFIHENWRWQTPIRALKAVLDEGSLGRVFRARLTMVSGFELFANQPFLAELERFVLADMGSHILDVARFLFGEAEAVHCRTARIHAHVKGEDVATVVLHLRTGATVIVELGYPGTPYERERFPETFAFVEGERGSVELAGDYWIRVTTAGCTLARRHPPPRFAWADPRYDVVHASGVPCNENLLAALRGEGRAETTGEDNLKTVRLVFAAYESAASGEVVRV